MNENPVRAIDLLDRVRLLLPGTLVEEGALRREIFVLGQGGDLKKFEVLAIQYLRRFQHSIYAGKFPAALRVPADTARFRPGRETLRGLHPIMNELAPESRRDLYLLIARTAIQEGKTNSALMASDKALTLCAPVAWRRPRASSTARPPRS